MRGLNEETIRLKIKVVRKRAIAVPKAPSARELLARLRKFRGRISAGFKFDRIEANERL